MAFNRYMHPENRYKEPPDFKQLALKYPEFKKHCTQDIRGKILIDFKNPDALRILSQTLLLEDFQLHVDIPPGSLIPTIPSRLNYLLWIKDLLGTIPDLNPQHVHGLDIGTGACAVYPLLAFKLFNWSMVGTDVDTDSVQSALANVRTNRLESSIQIKGVPQGHILGSDLLQEDNKTFTFSMCNPPFYTSDILDLPPGKDCEVKTEGGEVTFVKSMVDQSKLLNDKVKIYTTLLGHKSSVVPCKQYLNQAGAKSIVTTEFCQGRCMRWGIAWTFIEALNLSKVKSTKNQKDKEKPFTWALPKGETTALNTFQRFKLWLTEVQVEVAVKKETKNFCSARISSKQRLWKNQRKQRRERKRDKPTVAVDQNKENVGKFSERMEADAGETNPEVQNILLDEIMHRNGARCLNSSDSTLAVDQANGNEPSSTNTNGNEPSSTNTNGSSIEPVVNQTNGNGLSNASQSNGHASTRAVNGDSFGFYNATETIAGKVGSELPDIPVVTQVPDTEDVPELPELPEPSELPCQLECDLRIRLAGCVLAVDIVYLGGEAGRDGVHQLLQFMKNKYNNPGV